MKKAFITGITGQDGSYLTELLLSKGYEVHGIVRKSSDFNFSKIEHVYIDLHNSAAKLFLHYGDLSDSGRLTNLLYEIQPQEVYHLAAQSHVRVSFDMPEYTGDITGLGTTKILEAIKRIRIKTKFYQASSSEMFGDSPAPQNEKTPFYPKSPYAAAKAYAYWMTINFREAFALFACNGIFFNHESPRRDRTFVTRKITRSMAKILSGQDKKIYLGNLDAKRDWGFAPEYVEAMHLILQRDEPDDYVIGTGEAHSVREFLEKTLNYLGIEIEWKGEGVQEKGIIKSIDSSWRVNIKRGDILIEIDPWFYRPTEVNCYLADASKSRKLLGWNPKVSFDELIKIMVDYDLISFNLKPKNEGTKILSKKGFVWTRGF